MLLLLLLLLAGALGLSLGCASQGIVSERPPLSRPGVDRISDETVRIRWPESFANGGTVRIYAGLSPDAFDRTRLLAATDASEVELTQSDAMPFLKDEYRAYFELVPSSGATPVVTAERLLPLDGPDNFRDLGGYETSDGRTVRWGQLFRSNPSLLCHSLTKFWISFDFQNGFYEQIWVIPLN